MCIKNHRHKEQFTSMQSNSCFSTHSLFYFFIHYDSNREKNFFFLGFIASFCGFVLALLHHSIYFIRNFIVYAVITHHHHKLQYVKLASYFQREKKASKDNKHKIKNNNNEYFEFLSRVSMRRKMEMNFFIVFHEKKAVELKMEIS